MPRLLFVVEDTFAIKGRGVVLFPGVLESDGVRIRDPIRIVRPDGSARTVTLRGAERLMSLAAVAMPIVLDGVEKADVPIGTEVWSGGDEPILHANVGGSQR